MQQKGNKRHTESVFLEKPTRVPDTSIISSREKDVVACQFEFSFGT